MAPRIYLRGQYWDIVTQKRVKDDEGNDLDGRCDYATNKIIIDSTMNPQRKGLVLTHEALHACLEGFFEHSAEEELAVRFMEASVYELVNGFPKRWKR